MEQAIIWAVVWGLLALLTSGVVGWVVGLALGALGLALDMDWVAILGVALGWISGVTWFILCVIWSVQSIITAVQLS